MGNAEKIEELQQIIDEDASNFQARRRLAVLLLDSGYPEESLQHFLYLSKIFPTDSGIFYNLGIVYEKLKFLDKAEVAYKKAIELSPEEADAYYNLGLVYIDMQKYDNAIDCFNTVLDIDDDDSNAYFNMGLCYFKKNDLIEAMDNFQKTVDMNDDDIYAHFYIGNIFKEFGDTEGAAEQFRKVLEISPDYSWAYYNLAVIDFENGNIEYAAGNLEKTIELNPKDIGAYKVYAKLLAKYEMYDEAYNAAASAIENCGGNGDIYYIWAQIDKLRENMEEYEEHLKLALQYYQSLTITPKIIKDELQAMKL